MNPVTSPVSDDDEHSLAARFPLTWTFHRNTSRWTFNTLAPGRDDSPEPPRDLLDRPYSALPDPAAIGGGLHDALVERHSCRSFSPAPIHLTELSALLKFSYGIIGESSFGPLPFYERPVPSGGGMYPLDLYLIVSRAAGLAPGSYRYTPVTHGLECVREGALPPRLLTYLCMGQSYAGDAPVLLVIGAAFARSMKKYGDRGYRYLLLEAGHIAQNINLLCPGLGLGSCNLGGFYDVELAGLLRMDLAAEAPLYAIALGRPTHPDRERSRGPE